MSPSESFFPSPDSPSPEHQGLLHVGHQPITADHLMVTLRRHGLLPAVIKELVIDQAIAALPDDNLSVAAGPITAETALEQAIATFRQTHQLANETQVNAFLQQRGLTPTDLGPLALRHQKLQQFKQATWGNQVESYFLQRKQQLDRVLYSLIRTREAGLAQELYFRIQDDGHPFADLAREFSAGQEAQTGGLIGPVELAVPHPALARVLAVSQPGQLWPPTPMGEWFVIVRLEKFLPARLDDPTRQRLLDELFNTWLSEQVQKNLGDL
ncbi:peptidylprolyl isomerase [Nodosilinea sp. P-1105]|uniref:peptidylprolyl isomerase n=1 Tax=Nodosilinea sp. P-1105 TaxID=2546229 RepID=UPI001F0D694B|nr:peptidylprolyl isomerase [Nodosilinea sp. P-1105]